MAVPVRRVSLAQRRRKRLYPDEAYGVIVIPLIKVGAGLVIGPGLYVGAVLGTRSSPGLSPSATLAPSATLTPGATSTAAT